MQKKMASFILLLLTMFILATPSRTPTAQSPLRIAFPVFPPFHWIDENGGMKGFFYDIMTEALQKRMGLPVVWNAYPWQRCQENVKIGKDDAIITVPTQERSVYALSHKDPFYSKPLNIFYGVDNSRSSDIIKIKTLADIKEGGFSVITYNGNGWHKENVESLGIKTFETPSLENVWKMLAGKRGDLVIEWPLGAWPDIKRSGVVDKIIDTKITVSSMPFHLLIGKGSPHANVLDAFNSTVKKMKEDGTVDSIISSYY